MAGYQVVTSSLRKEATKWDPHAETITVVHKAAEGMTLDLTAFWIGDGINYLLTSGVAYIDKSNYDKLQNFMEAKLSTAGEQMSRMGDVLIKAATTYEQHEEVVELEMNDWSKKLGE